MSCPIGRSDKSAIMIENATNVTAMFGMENTNASAFQMMCKPTFEIRAKQRGTVGILCIPFSLGQAEDAIISFRSPELGTYTYTVLNTGKLPQIYSRLVFETMIGTTCSGSIDFVNPSPFKMTHSFSLSTDASGIFALLSKRRSFILSPYGELRQIPFTFAPPTIGHYCADIVLVARDEMKCFFPIRATGTASRGLFVQSLTGRARQLIPRYISFPVVGEEEDFDATEYIAEFTFPRGYEFLSSLLSISQTEIQRVSRITTLVAEVQCHRNV
jgi:hypothetical protein